MAFVLLLEKNCGGLQERRLFVGNMAAFMRENGGRCVPRSRLLGLDMRWTQYDASDMNNYLSLR